MRAKNRYEQLIEAIFFEHYSEGTEAFEFKRVEIEEQAKRLGVKLPKNLGDLVYSFRYRTPLPDSIIECASEGRHWVIEPAGIGCYRFVAARASAQVTPNTMLAETKVPDATPGVISMYALSDEQALLAKLRYNRLLDLFTRVTCYSLQNHLRTTVPDLGQVETDEVYVGIGREGAHYVFPVEAKGPRDTISLVQIKQDMGVCGHKFPTLICRPIAAQFMKGDLIALFEFSDEGDDTRIRLEKHYRLVPPEELTDADLEAYRRDTESARE